MFEPQQKTSSPKILVKIGVSHAAGRKSESDYLKLHNKLLLWSNPHGKQQTSTSETSRAATHYRNGNGRPFGSRFSSFHSSNGTGRVAGRPLRP
jgi:hypothetical protein